MGTIDKMQQGMGLSTDLSEEIYVIPGTELAEDDELPVIKQSLQESQASAQSVAEFELRGEKGSYRVQEKPLSSSGAQSRLFLSRKEQDNQTYILKLYYSNMIKENKLNAVLDKLQQGKHVNVTTVVEHGICELVGQQYHYVIMPRYQRLSRQVYSYVNNLGDPKYERRMLHLIRQLNNGLKFLHNQGIWHGDIKPENIMWNATERCAVLIDFGGSAKTDESGKTTIAAATTNAYLPGEATGNNKLNRYVDYYALGVTLAELLNGAYPKQEEAVRRIVGETDMVGYCYIPKNLPKAFKNLIEGLVYENNDPALRKQYRWTGDDIDTWLNYMYNGKYTDAENYKNVKKVSMGVQGILDDGKMHFREHLYLPIGGSRRSFDTLEDVVDGFAENWDDGINIMLKDGFFDRGKVGGDIRNIVVDASDRMKGVNEKAGESMQAEYFKFLYQYVSDKKTFRWKQLPGVTDKETFALRLLATLNTLRSSQYNFGNWRKNMNETDKSRTTVFAEIFANQVFSTYLVASGEIEPKLLKQCEKVEKIFKTPKNQYTPEEVTEMYVLVYMILGTKTYKLKNGTEYKEYRDFADDIKKCLANQANANAIFELWKQISMGEYYAPSFYAWLKLNDPKYAKSIKHNIKL